MSPDARLVLIEVTRDDDLVAVGEVYGEIKALQLVWPDSAGNLPWDPGYRNPPEAQPFLGPVPPEFGARDTD